MRPLPAVLVVLAAVTGAAAGGGSLKGTVTGGTRDSRRLADAVILVGDAAVPAKRDAPHARIDQRDQVFVPRVVAVPVGATVDFLNSDPFLHNVVSSSPAKTFDVGMFGTGETRSVTFDHPGVVRVGCAVHPRMSARVVVHSNPWTAVTDARGDYTIVGIPPGRHGVRIQHEDHPQRRTAVTIYEGQVQRLDAALGPQR
jgi:plastocyanin